MTVVRRPLVPAVTAILAAVVLSACGIPLQSSAEPLPANVLPAPFPTPEPPVTPTETSAATSAAPVPAVSVVPTTPRLRLWFVQEDGLAAVESALPAGTPVDQVVRTLAIGPTDEQIAEGLRTVARDPLTGEPLVALAQPPEAPAEPSSTATGAATGPPAPGEPDLAASVTVQLSRAFTALPPGEQVLLLGQVVLSLTGAGEASVAFVDEAGAALAVPLPDGRLLDAPATARDYNALIVRP